MYLRGREGKKLFLRENDRLMILVVLNRFFLLWSFLFLLGGTGVVIIDAARSIGSSELILTSLYDLMLKWKGSVWQFFHDIEPQGFADMAFHTIFHLPAFAVFMTLALLFYVLSYIFKTN